MSPAPQRALPNTKPLTRAERAVLQHIAMYCGESRRLVQSLRRIADATFLSHVGVHKAIDGLNERQLIRTIAGAGNRTSEHICCYQVVGLLERVNADARSGPPSGRSPRVRVKAVAVAGGAR